VQVGVVWGGEGWGGGWGGRGGGGGGSRKIMEIPGGGGSTVKTPGTENPGEWGVKLEKNPPWGGRYGYISGTTHSISS